ncbi:MAG: hypothetical protein LC798_03515 [Chloroflexi bacterium]|nr:hypothetical protein [Chloroflexota bacterium]
MSDQEFVIELEEDTEGHASRRAIVETDDADWLEQKVRSDSGTKRLRLLPDDSDDTEGHGATITVRAVLADDDDTEGHAIALRFPSRTDADAFRRRLLMTGVLVGTVALGAAGGVGLSALQSDAGTTGAGAAASSVTGSDWTQAERPLGVQTQSQADANFQAAAAAEGERQGAASAAQAQADANFQAAAAAEGERQGAASAAQAQADANYLEASANEAARQGSTDSTADDSAEVRNIGGPTPR